MAGASFDCLTDPAAFVIDGANRICRLGDAGYGLRAGVLIAGLLCVGGFALAAKRPNVNSKLMTVVIAVALAALLPGLVMVLLVRADAPMQASRTADVVRERMTSFRAAATGLACVDVVKDECIACQPLAQLTFRACGPPPKAPAALQGRAQFGESAFTMPDCERQGATVLCGTSP